MLVELTQGAVINVPAFGGGQDVAPSSFFVDAVPELAFDTFVAQGATRSDDPNAIASPNLGGGAVNIDPTEVNAVFNDATKISQSWFPGGLIDIRDKSEFVVAQVTLTADANGSFEYFALVGGEFFSTQSLFIRNGSIADLTFFPPEPCIPEPVMAMVPILALAAGHRRKAYVKSRMRGRVSCARTGVRGL